MSNSPLVSYTKISPNSTNPRRGKISKITIHHMAGNLTIEQCGIGFSAKSRHASSNYGVGTDGRIGLYVEEKNRSWASSNPPNDDIAVTIEVANDADATGNWHVSDKALEACINLCVDICKRNGIKRLNFTGDKSGNLTMHRYFVATVCPGGYLVSKFPYIANEVNKRLSGAQTPKKELKSTNDIVWELAHRGIISDKELWLSKMTPNSPAYWLGYKIANKTVNSTEKELESVNDIVWELKHRGIISDSALWLDLLNKDRNLYCLAKKAVKMTKGGV